MENEWNCWKYALHPNAGVVSRTLQSNESVAKESIQSFEKPQKHSQSHWLQGDISGRAEIQLVYGVCPT